MDIVKEVTLVGYETFKTGEGEEMAKIVVLEDYPKTDGSIAGANGANEYFGQQVGVEYTMSVDTVRAVSRTLPAQITLVKGLQKDQKNRDVVKLLAIQSGWASKIKMDDAVNKISNSGK